MRLDVIATGSAGNSYLLRSDSECLIIECGMPFKKVKETLDFNIMPIVGCIVSHTHQDHFKHHSEYSVAGIPLFMPFVSESKYQQFGHFYIKSFALPHGDIVSYGFYIKHDEIGQMLFLTDFEYCPLDFSKQKVEHILVECNYQLDMVDTGAPNFRHKIQGHASLGMCKEFVRHNASEKLRNVVLIHASGSTLDYEHAVNEVKSVCDGDVNVVVAQAGMNIKINKEAF